MSTTDMGPLIGLGAVMTIAFFITASLMFYPDEIDDLFFALGKRLRSLFSSKAGRSAESVENGASGLAVGEPAGFASSFPVTEPSPVAKEEELEPAKPLGAIGYKYADIGRDGFLGLAKGKSYRVNSTVESEAMGFHSYKSIELLQKNTHAYEQRGSLLLEVLHYGEVKEYEDGWVSTGQRILQIAQDPGLCAHLSDWTDGTRRYCPDQPEFQVLLPLKISDRYCRPHYVQVRHGLKLIPHRRVINIQQWLAKFKDSPAARRVKVNLGLEELVPTGSKPKRASGLRWR